MDAVLEVRAKKRGVIVGKLGTTKWLYFGASLFCAFATHPVHATFFENGAELLEACDEYIPSPGSAKFPTFNCWYDVTKNVPMLRVMRNLEGDNCLQAGLNRLHHQYSSEDQARSTYQSPSRYDLKLIELIAHGIRACPSYRSLSTNAAIECALRRQFCP